MKIGDLFKRVNIAPTGKPEVWNSGRELQEESKRASTGGDDWVTISPEARRYARISQVVEEDEPERRNKVEELKERIENGEYEVSSEEVAKAILSYWRQGKTS